MAYRADVADYVCEQMALGRTLLDVCREKRKADPSWPSEGAIRMWYIRDEQGFREVYVRAREAQTEAWSDQVIDLSDTPVQAERVTHKAAGGTERVIGDNVERSKLMVQSRQWLMPRLNPAAFGDRMAHQALDADGKRTSLPGSGPFRVEIVG